MISFESLLQIMHQSLIDLTNRLLAKPMVSIQVPRFLDFICNEFLFRKMTVEQENLRNLFPSDTNLLSKLAKNVGRFIIDKKGIPEEFFLNSDGSLRMIYEGLSLSSSL